MSARYDAYAKAHGLSTDAMLKHDAERFPGGKMAGYIIWIGQRWAEWHALRKIPRDWPKSQLDHDNFDAWLSTWHVCEDEHFRCACCERLLCSVCVGTGNDDLPSGDYEFRGAELCTPCWEWEHNVASYRPSETCAICDRTSCDCDAAYERMVDARASE